MRKYAVIGLGCFGQHLARALTSAGDEVIAIDNDPKLVEQMRDEVALAVRMDGTDTVALEAQGVAEVDVAIVGIGEDFEAAALTVAALKEIGVKHIVSRAMNDIQATILRKVGADDIASAEHESANRWAHRLSMPKLEQYLQLGESFSLINIKAPQVFCGKTLLELDLRKKYQVNLVAIRRQVEEVDNKGKSKGTAEVVSVPHPDTKVLPGDTLTLVGSNEHLTKLPAD